MFELSEADEATLDRFENVPRAYEKEIEAVEFTSKDGSIPSKTEVLIYIDHKRIKPNKPKAEYISRINKGIEDGVKEGIPESYFEKYFRPFIPPTEVGSTLEIQLAALDHPSSYHTT